MRKCPECAREFDNTYDVCDCGHVFVLRRPAAGTEWAQGEMSPSLHEAPPLRLFVRVGSGLGGLLVGLVIGELSVAGSADDLQDVSRMVVDYVGSGVGALVGGVVGVIVSWRMEEKARERSDRNAGCRR